MKLGDGRKVTMHLTPACDVRSQLDSEASMLMAEWVSAKDDVRMTPQNSPKYSQVVAEAKAIKRRFDAAENRRSQHIREHGCW